MKVVLFCGGLGMRMRADAESVPKPLVTVGYRPILWHVMRYYAHFGHKEFILCLGYKADAFKNYFRNYDECLSNDFVLLGGSREVQLYNSDIHDWSITFADTGLYSNVGRRLMAARKYLEAEDMFLANYTDGVSDLPLPKMIEAFRRTDNVACFVSIKPTMTFHVIQVSEAGQVTDIQAGGETDIHVNGGFFILRKEIFNYIQEGEELVEQPFRRLIAERKLMAYRYDGFWKNMDTFKDKQALDELYETGNTPWEIWKT